MIENTRSLIVGKINHTSLYNNPNNNIPVFTVKREDGEGRCKTLHRNLLLPIGSKLPSPLPTPRQRVKEPELQNMESNISPIGDTEESEEDEDEPFLTGTGYQATDFRRP